MSKLVELKKTFHLRTDVNIISILSAFSSSPEKVPGWWEDEEGEPVDGWDAVDWYETRKVAGFELKSWYDSLSREVRERMEKSTALIPVWSEDFSGIHICALKLTWDDKKELIEHFKTYWQALHERMRLEAERMCEEWIITRQDEIEGVYSEWVLKDPKSNISWGHIVWTGGHLIFPGKLPFTPMVFNVGNQVYIDDWFSLQDWEMYRSLNIECSEGVRRSESHVRAFYRCLAMLKRLKNLREIDPLRNRE